jgi:hypothetical protein
VEPISVTSTGLSQLTTLIWLKWTLFRNSFRSSKQAINRLASFLGLVLAVVFATLMSVGFGVVAYALSKPGALQEVLDSRATGSIDPALPAELIFFTILAFCYLLWATVPLSTGSSRQFDPGNLLMYPISLRKLFATDLISELVTLPSIFAIPAILALAIGAGLATGMIGRAIVAGFAAAACGLALTKWLSISIGSLTRRKRTRGETLIALIGAAVGLGGALIGQVAPVIFKHAEFVKFFRWTPPGAAALAFTTGLKGETWAFLLGVFVLSAYAVILIIASFWVARRSVLGIGGARRKISAIRLSEKQIYTGWKLPLLSSELSAVVEKELRYVLRNAQVRMMALMPLILIAVKIANSRRFGRGMAGGTSGLSKDFMFYGSGLMAAGGVLYVFLVLSGLSCNQFAFEEGGMRTLVLSPVERKKILIGKNLALTVVALVFSVMLLTINHLIFRDLTWGSLLFVSLTFVIFAALMSVMGNWLSIRFPKHMKFGKRLNVSGVVGLLLIPMMIVLSLPSLGATAAGYLSQSLTIEYVTLLMFTVFAVGLYVLVIDSQGESLEQRETEILETVREPADE